MTAFLAASYLAVSFGSVPENASQPTISKVMLWYWPAVVGSQLRSIAYA
jgi:hypothetical protein